MALNLSNVSLPSNSNKGDEQEFLTDLAQAIEAYVADVAFGEELPQGISLDPDPDNAGLYLLH